MTKEDEYKEMFLAEALESYEQLNNLFTELEKDHQNKMAIDAIFRITHTLKGNAMGMGFQAISELSHAMEDIFSEAKQGKIKLDADLFQSLFKANDALGQLIDAIKTDEVVRYKGILTKLQVFIRKIQENDSNNPSPQNANPTEKNTTDIEKKAIEESVIEEETEEISTQDTSSKITLSDMVQVPVRKLDELLNIVGELIIEKDTLIAQYLDRGISTTELSRLHRITSDLQYSVMDVRMVQIGFMFNKFHRILRDVANLEDKKVDLILEGTESEIDRNILKTISDSLVHLVRNAVSHGIETPQERLQKGKPEIGKVTLRARNEKDTVFIEIADDGYGIDIAKIKKKAINKGLISKEYAPIISDEEVMMCLFEPGFSNAEVVTEVSGRGVGLDVVRLAVESIGGKVSVQTELGKGSTFILSLPSSMAVKGALLFELNKQEFAIALNYTEAVISLHKSKIHKINTGLITTYLGKTISIVFLQDLFQLKNLKEVVKPGAFHTTFDLLQDDPKLDVVIVSYNNKMLGLVVDKLMQQKEIVEKTLPAPVDNVALFSGATILGNGNMCLVLDIVSILTHLFREKRMTTNYEHI